MPLLKMSKVLVSCSHPFSRSVAREGPSTSLWLPGSSCPRPFSGEALREAVCEEYAQGRQEGKAWEQRVCVARPG